ncbi:hypothetical protein FOXB_06432 [Fusarium oxysporum f. sp. conglutinans Fo5176]|uniref:Transcription factor domain-containing protein n=1 Tax=Fusarium oxysporum (strain Fo5176) TaxID=660025 RepID=F9FJ53_FUSOF|nr:hypothetical protein FOXB_06432 [Fusarium oxysporum f. sp. conglutinans Fo5176]
MPSQQQQQKQPTLVKKRGEKCHFSPMRARRLSYAARSISQQSIASDGTSRSNASPASQPTRSSIQSQTPVMGESTITYPGADESLPGYGSPNASMQLQPQAYPTPALPEQPVSLPTTGARLYIDEILSHQQPLQSRTNDKTLFTADDEHVGSSGLAFYSEKSMASLSRRLGHNRVSQLIAIIESQTVLGMNLLTDCDTTSPSHPIGEDDLGAAPQVEAHLAYVEALGCMYRDGGSFRPGEGLAWRLFSQALCAMAIYSLTAEGFRYEGLFIREAARAAAALSKREFEDPRRESSRRATFWIIYYIEKEYSFHTTLSSVICDEDVSCPLPYPRPVVMDESGLDWIQTAAVFSRILSKAYISLFSVSATMKPKEECLAEIDSLGAEVDGWLQSLPDELRPRHEVWNIRFTKLASLIIALRIQIMYYGLKVSLARLALHLSGSESGRGSEAKASLLLAARAIVGLTQQVPQEPYTPMICLTHMPMMATFILFDYVVQNPRHPETRKSLAYLDITAGYFSRLNLVYASKGTPFGNHLGEFAAIAHQYIRSQEKDGHRPQGAFSDGTAIDPHPDLSLEPIATNQSTGMPELQQNLTLSPPNTVQTLPNSEAAASDMLT